MTVSLVGGTLWCFFPYHELLTSWRQITNSNTYRHLIGPYFFQQTCVTIGPPVRPRPIERKDDIPDSWLYIESGGASRDSSWLSRSRNKGSLFKEKGYSVKLPVCDLSAQASTWWPCVTFECCWGMTTKVWDIFNRMGPVKNQILVEITYRLLKQRKNCMIDQELSQLSNYWF